MATLTAGVETDRNGRPCPAAPFGYVSVCHGGKISRDELWERLHVIMEMSRGISLVAENLIANPEMDTETVGLARLVHAGAGEILAQAYRLEPDAAAGKNAA